MDLPKSVDMEMDILKWWKDYVEPAEKAKHKPRLGAMVKQFLGSPATTGGIERVFSGVGAMHGDFRKNAMEKTLQSSLKATINNKKVDYCSSRGWTSSRFVLRKTN